MLGDREHDIIGARNNGIVGVGALWGYGTKGELQAIGAAILAANPSEATRLIAAL